MFAVGDKQISFAHITRLEWIAELGKAVHPESAKIIDTYMFDVHTTYDHVERMVFDTEEGRLEAWDDLVDRMEASGY